MNQDRSTTTIIPLSEMAKELTEKHGLSSILVNNWERAGRLAYNYHTLTKTVDKSAAYQYAIDVIKKENKEGLRYLVFLRLSIDGRLDIKTLHNNSMLPTEQLVDSIESFKESLRRFLKKTPSLSFGYLKAAKEMYVSKESPISYKTFPNSNKVWQRWYASTIRIEDLEAEKAHLQMIYDTLFTNNHKRALWLESVGRIE